MIRVLNAIHFPVFGGPHNQALRLAEPLASRGFQTLVVMPDEPGNAAERLRAGGVDVRVLPLHRLRATRAPGVHLGMARGFLAEVQGLRTLIRSERISIVQVGGLVNPHAAIAARLEHVPVVWQLLDTRAPRPVASAAMICVRGLADVVMSTGSAVAEAHPGYPAIADRVIPFFPPVQLERFAPHPELRAEVRSAWGIPATALVVGCVANINPQKGIIELVRGFARARSGQVGGRLVLVGAEYSTHADYSAAVRAEMAIERLVEGRDVVFVGERDDVERQLAGMDMIALAAVSRSEGITTAVLEGMAAGLPVVVTDVGALREAVADGRTGFLVPPGDADAFAAALARLLGDQPLRQQMGQEARRVANERFGVDSCADAHVRAYARALAAHGKANSLPTLAALSSGPVPNTAGRLVDGIPVFVDDPRIAEHDEIDHLHAGHDHAARGNAHKEAQAEHFDRALAEEFEITRPHGTPRLYRFLLREKFRRATAPIGPHLVGASALTVCGGSGMDAEFLARAGARVIASDISLGAARRARERARRYGLDITPIVADVERLPFADRAFDVVLVHDGLHHLEHPEVGLAEMARVARRWVSVTEPARAAATSIAVKAGAALEREESGNRVARLTPVEVAGVLRTAGLRPIVVRRYAMYYRHQPGWVFRFLSRGSVFPVVRAGWRAANALIGRFGNKLVVVAEREGR